MNPFVGVFFHWLGGLASGSFYVPYRFVKKWSWEVYWLAGGFFSWIIAPWVAALLLTNNLFGVLGTAISTEPRAVGFAFLFGLMWGMGGLTFGLTMRYLGMSLGMAVALGYCTAFGTLMGPLFSFDKSRGWEGFMEGKFVTQVLGTDSGIIILFGVGVCMLGIVIAALAGASKEREMSEEAKKEAIKEFSFVKGLLVATFSGIMSAGMAYGMAAATPIAELSMEAGTPRMWVELPRLPIILAGGFTSNFLWCAFLFLKNKTGHQFFAKELPDPGDAKETLVLENATDAPGEEVAKAAALKKVDSSNLRVPMFANYLFCAIAGTTWYLQFFFYSMGETQMGVYQFSSWPLHMASIMIFSSLWGLALREWKGSSGYTKTVLFVTLFTLIFSTMIMGYGTNLGKVENEKKLYNIAEKIALETEIITSTVQGGDLDDGEFRKVLDVKRSLVDSAKQLAEYRDGEAEKEDVLKRKTKGLLDDTQLTSHEVPDLPEGEKAPPQTVFSSMFTSKYEMKKVGKEKVNELIMHTTALAETEDPAMIQLKSEMLRDTVREFVEILKEKTRKPGREDETDADSNSDRKEGLSAAELK